MKKLICLILAVTMVIAVVPVGAVSSGRSDTPYEVYNLTFENEDDLNQKFTMDTELIEDGFTGKALKAKAAENPTKSFSFPLSDMQRNCLSTYSVKVKHCGGVNTAVAELIGIVKISGNATEFVLDRKNVSSNSWITLNGRMQTKFMKLDSNPEIKIRVTQGDEPVDFAIDDFVAYSDVVTAAASRTPVPDIKSQYTGNVLERASFEKPTLEMFDFKPSATYEITNAVPAHTGEYCLRMYDRAYSWDSCRVTYNDIDLKNSKIKISLWVKKSPDVGSCNFSVQGEIQLSDTTKEWPWLSTVSVADDNWHLLEAEIDCASYNVGSYVGFQISIGDTNYNDYYVDDMVVSIDCPGPLYDDMDYVVGAVKEGISKTPSTKSPVAIPIQEDIPSLKDVYKDYFKIGVCIPGSSGERFDRKETGRLVIKHFNSIVHNGYFKMPEILTSGDRVSYDFSKADEMMVFAQRNNIEDVVGHNLIWELRPVGVYAKDDNGDWLSRDEALAFFKEYITKIMKHFEGDGDPSEYQAGVDYSDWHIAAWDVTNEAVQAGKDVYANRGAFINCIGNDYVDYAFKYADETGYDDVQLRYNDFGEQNPGKRQAMYDVVKKLQNKGIRIDTLGMQGHYRINVLSSQVRDALELFSSLGVAIDVTEADISAYTDSQIANRTPMYEDGVTVAAETAQANLYYELFQIYKEYADVIDRVTFWTYLDGVSYQNESDGFNRTDYAGIFDRDYQAKPQFWAIADPEYYFSSVLNEDTSRLRLTLDGEDIVYDADDVINQGSVACINIEYLFDILDIEYVETSGVYSTIREDKFISLKAGKQQIYGFKDYEMQSEIISKDSKLFVPVVELCNLLDYTAEYNSARNIIGISSNQMSNNL